MELTNEIKTRIDLLFCKYQNLLPVVYEVVNKLVTRYPDMEIVIQKSQLSFRLRHPFVYLWPPTHSGIKGKGKPFVVLTFMLDFKIDSERVSQIAEPYPHRFTHHVVLSLTEEVNDELMSWIHESFLFKNR